MTAALERARAVADAVLYEGYLLYPYRASAAKNTVRWQWGVLMPPRVAANGTGEHADSRAELIAEPRPGAVLHARLRCLQLRRRTVEVEGTPVPALVVDGTEYTSFDEAVECEVDSVVGIADLLGRDHVVPFTIDGGEDREPVGDARLVWRRAELHGELVLRADPLSGPYGGVRLTVLVRNTSGWAGAGPRDEALPHALIAAHTVLSLSPGAFLSSVEPPEWAKPAVAECTNERVWPVLVGDADTVLCSPIILYDYPEIAEQSAGNLFDGTEIDEILTLRTMTLTDEEKREARATDPRAAELIDRVDGLPPELLDRLHGTIRYLRSVTEPADVTARPDVPWWDPGADSSVSPETDTIVIDGVRVGAGSRVRLRPNKRADAHDMFLAGRIAVVRAVLLDVDDEWHVAVTVADDEGAELYAQHGRYRYFGPDEIEPLVGPVTTKVLVAGVGNVFLGDDGFGVDVVRELSTLDLPEWVRVADYGIRGMHLAYDLAGGDYATTSSSTRPVATTRRARCTSSSSIRPPQPPASVLDAHGMQPDVVLGLVRLLGGDPGRVLLVGCEPEVLDHRMGLSPPVARAVATAVAAVLEIIREHDGKGTGVPCASAFPVR